MDLAEKNRENVDHMVTEIKNKLDLVNEQMIKPEDYNLEQYDELLEIYQMIQKKSSISIMEKEAILDELGKLRNAE